MTDVYKKLAAHLENTPCGFPATESGVEIRILKQLFTEQEAEIATNLIMMAEPAEVIAKKMNKDAKWLTPILKEMSDKGLILRVTKKDSDLYMTAQFVIGIWEYQVNRLTKELIKDVNEYLPYLMKEHEKHKTRQLRVIPVSKAISADMKVMDYEEAEKIIRAQSKIVIAPCICRKEHKMVGKGCDHLEDGCFVFGGGAYYYEQRGIGRSVDHEEAIAVMKKGVAEGLVLQPGNSLKTMNICMCCDCCCQILSFIKKSDKPSTAVNSNYFASVNEDLCTGCAACQEICPMEAITLDGVASVNKDRCIGCGLCVASCEFESMKLNAKDESQKWVPPATIVDTYMAIAQERGLI
ncbi:MAG: 4Fe-4S binding protein [Desulfamplus sp.]|nr:4Fe-4S binding protein [Desulfamplus sp.]